MWILVVTTVSLTLTSCRALPLDLDTVSDILEELEELPVDETTDDTVSPELVDLYRDVELLYEMQQSNLSESREGRGLLSKLSFLTGLKLGSFLTSSGTLAASQSINFLGKVLNAALSISYGNIGGYPGLYGGLGGGNIGEGGEQLVGLQKLPVIQEDIPLQEDKKREKPDDPLVSPPVSSSSNKDDKVSTPEVVKKEFIKQHNQRVENFNKDFDSKIKTRTGRIRESTFEQIT